MSYHKSARASPREVDTFCVATKMADHPLLLVAVGVVRRRPVKIVDRGDYVILLMCMMRIVCV